MFMLVRDMLCDLFHSMIQFIQEWYPIRYRKELQVEASHYLPLA